MKITIEFTGAPRAITGTKELSLSIDEGTTYSNIIHELSLRYPALIGVIISKDGYSLLSASIISVNGEKTILPGMMDERPNEGDRLILVYFMVGG